MDWSEGELEMSVSKLLETRSPICGPLQGRRAPARASTSRLVVVAGVQQNGLGLQRSSASFVRQDLLIPSQLIDCKVRILTRKGTILLAEVWEFVSSWVPNTLQLRELARDQLGQSP